MNDLKPNRRADWRAPGLSLIAKLGASPIVALAWLSSASIVIGSVGVKGYATFAIISGLAVLLPFADLGMGAAVMDAVARRSDPGAPSVGRVLQATWRLLIMMALLITIVAVAFAILGIWSHVFGVPEQKRVELAATLTIAVFALGLPLSVGPRILTGMGLNHWVVGLQTLSAGIMLLLVWSASLITDRLEAFAVAPFLGAALANAVGLAIALRALRLDPRPIVSQLLRPEAPSIRLRTVAGPMFLISIILPLAFQTDRIILSHLTTASEVAKYSLAFQIYSPLLGAIGSAGSALWPIFTRVRNENPNNVRRLFYRFQLVFLFGGLVFSAVLILVAPTVASVVSRGQVTIPWPLVTIFGVLLIVQAASYPMAMLLTKPQELRFQARLHVGMLAVNLPLSCYLAVQMGAAGPVLASVLAVAVILFIPEAIRVRNATVPSN